MKLNIADTKALSELSPNALTAYLRSHDWTLARVENEVGFFYKSIDGENAECDVPLRQSFRDYPRRVREILENLTLIEDRSQYDIYQDLVRMNQDIVSRVGLDEAGVPPDVRRSSTSPAATCKKR